jgi:hypothetical protein
MVHLLQVGAKKALLGDVEIDRLLGSRVDAERLRDAR